MCFRIAQIHANNTVEMEALREGGEHTKVAYDQLKPPRGSFNLIEKKQSCESHPTSITVPPQNFLQVAAAMTLTIFLLVQVRKNTNKP